MCNVTYFCATLCGWLVREVVSELVSRLVTELRNYESMSHITWKKLLLLLFCFNFITLFVSMHANLLDLSVFRVPMVTVTPSHSWSVCCNVLKRQCIFLLIIATFFATAAKYECVKHTHASINRNVSRFSTQ